MTLDKARELLTVQANTGGGYNRNGARLILAEVQRDHGQQTVDSFIRKLDLETLFGFKPLLNSRRPECHKPFNTSSQEKIRCQLN